MKLKKMFSILLSAVMVVNMASPAFGAEGNGENEIPYPILEFDFNSSMTKANEESGGITVKGKTMIDGAPGEITAQATNIEFATDELGNEIAVFSLGRDGRTPNIKYSSSTLQAGEKDPLKEFADGKGVTISAWVKTVGGDFQNTIFYYGKDSSTLHSSLQVLAQNDTKNNDGGERAFYYRGAEGGTGSTDLYDKDGKKIGVQQKPSKKGDTVYKDDVWQLVTYVEEKDGSGTLYIDGEKNVEWKNDKAGDNARSLYKLAHDKVDDVCYIGAKPGLAEEYFIGAMDSFSVYGEALSQDAIKQICNDFKTDKLDEAETAFAEAKAEASAIRNKGRGKYSTTSWKVFSDAVDDANEFNGTTLDDYSSAYKDLKRAQSGLTRTSDANEPIVEFNFSNVKQAGNDMEVAGVTWDGTEVTATAFGINFRDGVAIFPTTSASVGIQMKTESGKDPLEKLGNTEGTTVTMWVKPAESEFTSSLFAYGAAITNEKNEVTGLGRSIHVMGRNGLKPGTGTVFYREANGKTDVEGGGNQKISQKDDKVRPYEVNTWQMLTYVEEKDGNGVLYLDGEELGRYDVSKAKTKLYQYAGDEYEPDYYYIGYLPFEAGDGDTHFVGEMDSVAVYAKAMTIGEVDHVYEVKMLENAIKDAEKVVNNRSAYDSVTLNALETVLGEVKGLNLDKATTAEVEAARAKLETAQDNLKRSGESDTAWDKAYKALDDLYNGDAKRFYEEWGPETEEDEAKGIAVYGNDLWNEFHISYLVAGEDLEIAKSTKKITADKMNKDYNALKDALADMIPPEIREAREKLQKLITHVKETYKASDDEYAEDVVYYTTDTWTNLMTALDEAETAVNDVKSTAEQLNAAYTKLESAEKAMKKTDVQLWKEAKAALEAEVEAWKTTYDGNQQEYSEASWKKFKEAYEAASEYLGKLGNTTENPTAETAKMKELTDALKAAGEGLKAKDDAEKAADKAWADLQSTLDKWKDEYGNGTNTKDYTTDSWKAFTDAYKAAADTINAGRNADANLTKTAEDFKKLDDALENAGKALQTKDAAFKEAWDALKSSYDTNTEKYNATAKAYESGWEEFKAAYEAAGKALAAPTPYEPSGVTTEKLKELKTALDAAAAPDKLVAKTEEQLGKEALDEAWTKLAGALETYEPKHKAGPDAYAAGWEEFDKAYTAADKTINISPYEPDVPTVAGLTKLYNDLVAAAAEDKLIAKTAEQLDREALDEAWSALASTVETMEPKHAAGPDAYASGWEFFDEAYTAADKVINGTPYEPTGLTVAGLTLLRTNLITAAGGLKEKTAEQLAQEALDKAWAALAGTLEDWKDEHAAGAAMYSAGWEAFDTAYKMADNVINVNPYEPAMPTVALLEGYNDALIHAAGNLVKKTPDEIAKEELDKKVDEAEKIIEEGQKDNTDESWKNLEDALEDAKNPEPDAKEEDFKELQDALQDAIDNLQTNEEAAKEEAKKELDTVVEEAKSIIEAGQKDYTDESWKKFEEAYNKAKNPPENASAEDLKNLKNELKDAMEGLETKAEAELRKAVEEAKKLIDAGQGDYTDESWKNFTDAYEKAKNPPSDASEEDLKKLKEKLESAKKDLTKKLSEEEQKIVDLLGVSPETAKEIVQIMHEYNISLDTLGITAQTILGLKNDKDVKGSTFGLLQLKSVKETDKTIKVKWKKVKGADGYMIFGNKCGKSYKLLKTVGAGKTNFTQKKLKKGNYYKYLVLAYKNVKDTKVTLAASKTIHTATKGGKYGNAKAVTVKPGKVTVKLNKSKKVKATEVKKDKPIKKHRKINFESDKPEIATVNNKGKIKGKKKGKCTVYAYAQNGVFRKIKVTVK